MDHEQVTTPASNGGRIVKAAVVCIFVVTLIVWQQHYFDALDDVESSTTTLWNWPTIILVALGVLALAVRLFRFASRFRKPKQSNEK